ncbi:hypothetical protein LAG90_15625 [Marinilongibacter aquaticus]|uniref:hypothetical protein n=1 Tax=Marinilongibacter aquaticus TaxID=2975157 RepID=UPI0021BD7323|nr:hypothetical protein [Marinilongibacter aquaticus]UBM58233.1 hypothetical protein LAG90_15625 [Marinilongibacter aquaticus]
MGSVLNKIGKKVYTATYGHRQAVAITFGNDASKIIDTSEYSENDGKKPQSTSEYFKRGKSDDKLLQMHLLATNSPNKWQLLDTKGAFVAGAGFRLYKRDNEGLIDHSKALLPKEFQEWMEKLDISDYWEAASLQMAFGAELNIKLVLDSSTKKVESIEVLDNNEIRALRPKSGNRIESFLLNEEFGYSKNIDIDACTTLPAFDPKNPTKYPVSIIHLIARKPGQKIYGLANWWGTKRWTDVANKVPNYYEAAFRNGFFVTHHISFPDDYFDQEGLDDEAVEKLKEDTLNEITETLSSIDEANKIVVTFSKIAADGKSTLKEVKITPIPNPIKDEAFIKMFEAANLVQASGHGIPGKLAGVQLGSDMGSSGKEIAAEATYMQDFLTIFDRERLCKPLRYALKIDNVFQEYWLDIQRINSYVPGSTSKNDVSHPNNSQQ